MKWGLPLQFVRNLLFSELLMYSMYCGLFMWTHISTDKLVYCISVCTIYVPPYIFMRDMTYILYMTERIVLFITVLYHAKRDKYTWRKESDCILLYLLSSSCITWKYTWQKEPYCILLYFIIRSTTNIHDGKNRTVHYCTLSCDTWKIYVTERTARYITVLYFITRHTTNIHDGKSRTLYYRTLSYDTSKIFVKKRIVLYITVLFLAIQDILVKTWRKDSYCVLLYFTVRYMTNIHVRKNRILLCFILQHMTYIHERKKRTSMYYITGSPNWAPSAVHICGPSVWWA
jgi:hypothetical protein